MRNGLNWCAKRTFDCPVEHSLVNNCICFPFIGNVNITVGVVNILKFMIFQGLFPFLVRAKERDLAEFIISLVL
jgi:hypothetical protein